ncbi:MAG: molybdopterin-dependent oxidoreductase [Gammaproteobacteria bacterium]|jgi:anaerobic selenocysteine-containing dehydrogenase|nr:molybdopterin-dependent oxidoreductase [Gammaproteobacteria bacterium]MBT4986932.1 molybdopterin-dependent oxidoreductase [Pseudomonadota bacterium]MBT5684893.1 molybdopterin-dependent oxidoreductase [Gammaproteobacteria bacterium]MBT6889884.1 molybdopterin-dependent oxidoreductase [Gammaproteobacteria bacterium]MBT7879925.1 molybdopterin-dependent oxidoreductase [Gammaproteobacteria bacterium]
MTVTKSYCRICQGFCGTKVTVEDDQVVRVIGDRDDPLSRGYACFKGLQAPEQHNSEKRLTRSLKRVDGEWVADSTADILSQAGERLGEIIQKYGPGSVATYTGTQCYFNTLNPLAIGTFAATIGTPRSFYTMTIDQSAKWIAESRMGGWLGGQQVFENADCWLFFGSNPLVSMVAGAGASQFAFIDPVKTMKAQKRRGMKIIVVDPRRTETAKFADIHLQPKPGFDAEIAAAMLNLILQNNWHDQVFCDEYVSGLDDLTELVEPFDVEQVAMLAGLRSEDIVAAAETFARTSSSGMAGSGTGPNMAKHSNIAEHLIQALNVVCGRFPRAEEVLPNGGVLRELQSPSATVKPPFREWLDGPKTEKHGLGMIRGGMMSAEIVNEILEAPENPIKAMICVGGNLAAALPDQTKARVALERLELLVCIDPRETATTEYADYVIAPKLQYERADATITLEGMFQKPYGHVTKPVVAPPADADVVDDWFALACLAFHASQPMSIAGHQITPDSETTTEDLLSSISSGSQAGFDNVFEKAGGGLFPEMAVQISIRETSDRFLLVAEDVGLEISDLAVKLLEENQEPKYQLIVRRHRELMNSLGADFDSVKNRFGANPAYMGPEDMTQLGLKDGQAIQIVKGNLVLDAVAKTDRDLRPGVVSMSHCWSGSPDHPFQATNLLVDADSDVQEINRMPVMTGIAVEIRVFD